MTTSFEGTRVAAHNKKKSVICFRNIILIEPHWWACPSFSLSLVHRQFRHSPVYKRYQGACRFRLGFHRCCGNVPAREPHRARDRATDFFASAPTSQAWWQQARQNGEIEAVISAFLPASAVDTGVQTRPTSVRDGGTKRTASDK